MEPILIPTNFNNYPLVNHLHIELTNRCNAACPMCMRFHQSSPLLRPDIVLNDITLEQFKTWFPPQFLKQVILILFCGTYGDPIVCPDVFEITKYIIESSPKTNIMFNTNGGMRNSTWWKEFGNLLSVNPSNKVTFSIDGLEDTNHVYRRNVQWSKLISNVQAFIDSGGHALWDYLIFKHNEHQIETAKQLAYQLGFDAFYPKKALGVSNDTYLNDMGALTKEGTLDYIIEAPVHPENRNLENPKGHAGLSANFFTMEEYKKQKEEKSIQRHHAWKSNKIYDTISNDMFPKENSCGIQCKSLRSNIIDLFVDNYGTLYPCCYVATHMNGNYADAKTLQLHYEIKKYGLEKLNLRTQTIKEILDSGHLDNIFTTSWSKETITSGRLLFCAHTCGENNKIDKIYTHKGRTKL